MLLDVWKEAFVGVEFEFCLLASGFWLSVQNQPAAMSEQLETYDSQPAFAYVSPAEGCPAVAAEPSLDDARDGPELRRRAAKAEHATVFPS